MEGFMHREKLGVTDRFDRIEPNIAKHGLQEGNTLKSLLKIQGI